MNASANNSAVAQARTPYRFGGWLWPLYVLYLGLSVVFLVLSAFVPDTIEFIRREYGENFRLLLVAWAATAVVTWTISLLLAVVRSPLMPSFTITTMWLLMIWSNSLNIPVSGFQQAFEGFLVWAIVPVLTTIYLLRSERIAAIYRVGSRS